MIFYCKPYFKNVFDKNKNGNRDMYNETISKPSFFVKQGEKEKEVFLNGEVQEIKKVGGYVTIGPNGQPVQGPQRAVRKTTVCLKCLQVDENLKSQALRNVFNR